MLFGFRHAMGIKSRLPDGGRQVGSVLLLLSSSSSSSSLLLLFFRRMLVLGSGEGLLVRGSSVHGRIGVRSGCT